MSENSQSTADDPDSLSPERQCYCPLDGVIDLLSRKYAIQVVCAVGNLGPVRYGEIETAFGGVSSSTLSTRLDELTEAELLTRERYAEIPPRVEYDLTDDGEELCELLEPLLRWVEN
jgi:DNA-binding HxlR family transcriptional regulator